VGEIAFLRMALEKLRANLASIEDPQGREIDDMDVTVRNSSDGGKPVRERFAFSTSNIALPTPQNGRNCRALFFVDVFLGGVLEL
jgi:hypothetical protein